MYHILLAFQILMVVVCIFFIILMMRQKEGELSKLMLCIGFLSCAQNMGYLLEMTSKDLDSAMTAVRMEYLGGAFMGTFLLIFTMRYCGYHIKKSIEAALFCFDGAVLLGVWTYQFTTIYYSAAEFTYDGLFPHLVLHRGILYYLNILVLLSEISYCLYCIVHTKRRINDKTKQINLAMLGFSAFAPMMGLLMNWFGIIKSFDAGPGCVALGVAAFSVGIILHHVFDVVATAHENIIKTMDEAVLIVDAYGGFVEGNDKAKELFPGIRQPKDGLQISTADLEKIINQGNTFEFSVDTDTDRNFYEVHANKVWNDRILAGYAVVFVDVTQNKEQLRQMSQLKMNAEKANQAKSEFLARMSHEIRTPINAVMGMNEIILRESKEEETIRNAQDIRSSAQTLLGIINDILDFSKIESGKMEIVPAEYDLHNLLHDLISMTTLRAEEKGLKLENQIASNLPCGLYGDDIRIRQILLNILTNAVKYTEKGKITFLVDGERQSDGSVLLHFLIRDTGIGIKEEDMPRLFSAFERIEENHNRNIEGTGLGMNITIKLLKLMGSELKAESVYGKGSTFQFYLSQKIVNDEPIGDFGRWVRKTRQKNTYQPTFIAPDAQILLVDDNLVNRKVFCGLLKQMQLSITSIGSGRECLECVAAQHYDVIFLDHMMPEMDGVETYKRMKMLENNQCADTPVVMLTANAISGARERYLEMGFHDFLAKPIAQDKLDEMLEKYIPEEKRQYM